MDNMVWLYLFIGVWILLKLCCICSWLVRCLEICEEDKDEARVHYNPELGQITVPKTVEGLPPGHYVYVINSEINSEVPPPPYPGT